MTDGNVHKVRVGASAAVRHRAVLRFWVRPVRCVVESLATAQRRAEIQL